MAFISTDKPRWTGPPGDGDYGDCKVATTEVNPLAYAIGIDTDAGKGVGDEISGSIRMICAVRRDCPSCFSAPGRVWP